MEINKNYLDLKDSYLFATIARKTEEYQNANPDKKIIKLGIGDVKGPLCNAVIKGINDATKEMGNEKTFKGYGPYQGYESLRQAINDYYSKHNVCVDNNEIFVSDGAKSDVGNILDIFGLDNKVLIPDPVYPVYVDTNVMLGRDITYINAGPETGFLPVPDKSIKADIIYLCSPNNPTGAVFNYEELKAWVDYALSNEAVILYDAAYEAFITEEDKPKSIYEIPGSKKCAIEMCSLSKTAGFTGTRLGYTVVPNTLIFDNISLNKLWLRRQSTKFNGVSYIIQKGAEAVFTKDGIEQTGKAIKYYQKNATVITKVLDEMKIWYTGGINAPYIWLKCPNKMTSWEFFDLLLEKAQVVGTPGVGFGNNGEGYLRLTAFGNYDLTIEAMERIKKVLKEIK